MILRVSLFSDDVEARLLERFRRGCLYSPAHANGLGGVRLVR
jgi:hypothetical protein